MTGEAEESQGAERAAKKVEIDMEWVPALPGGRSVFPAEQQDRFVWLVAEGAMTEECFNEMREYLHYIAREGLWTQHWDGKAPPDLDGTPSPPA